LARANEIYFSIALDSRPPTPINAIIVAQIIIDTHK
jgi:hypothetical protein